MVSDCEVEVKDEDSDQAPPQNVINYSQNDSESGEVVSGNERIRLGVEPVVFLYMLANGMHLVIGTNLRMDKACRVNFNFTKEICDNINEHLVENDQVQGMITTLNVYDSFLSAIPCILVALLVGPWSDLHGRKPVMLIPLIGDILASIIYIFNVYFSQAPVEYILLSNIYSLFGGRFCFFIGMYSYLADTSSSRSRTSRIAFLDIASVVGWATGNFLSGFVYQAYGYYAIFGATLALFALAAAYLTFFVNDTRGNSLDNVQNHIPTSTFRKYFSIFNVDHIADVFQTCLKRRESKVRRVIWLLMLAMILYVAMFSAGAIPYLFSRKMFDWDEGTFTRFTTILVISGSACSFLIVPFLSFYLQIHDAIIGILATLFTVASLVVQSLSTTPNIFMLGLVLGMMGGQISVAIRSLLSKVTPVAELGKVYSLLAGLEAAVPLAASPLFSVIYNNTLDTFVGCVFLVEAGLVGASTIVFCYIFYLLRTHCQQFNVLVEDVETEENNGSV